MGALEITLLHHNNFNLINKIFAFIEVSLASRQFELNVIQNFER